MLDCLSPLKLLVPVVHPFLVFFIIPDELPEHPCYSQSCDSNGANPAMNRAGVWYVVCFCSLFEAMSPSPLFQATLHNGRGIALPFQQKWRQETESPDALLTSEALDWNSSDELRNITFRNRQQKRTFIPSPANRLCSAVRAPHAMYYRPFPFFRSPQVSAKLIAYRYTVFVCDKLLYERRG